MIKVACGRYIAALGQRKDIDDVDFQYVLNDHMDCIRHEIRNNLDRKYIVVFHSIYRNDRNGHFIFVYDVDISKRDFNALKLGNPFRSTTLQLYHQTFKEFEGYEGYTKVHGKCL